MKPPETRESKEPLPGAERTRRIDTQIHRRKKVKASLPLASEWDFASDGPPLTLRTPSEKMKNQPHQKEKANKDKPQKP